MPDTRAIGVFDSSLGGLTVLSKIHKHLPNESTVYLGDTARVPYGTKSPETVVRYALNNARALLSYAQLKVLVVACNTVSATAMEALQDALSIPVIGVIEPAVQTVMRQPAAKNIAVLATSTTVQSRAFELTFLKAGFSERIYSQACPMFVPLVEEGMISGPITEMIAEHYFQFLPPKLDMVVLGCTHYPLLAATLQNLLKPTYGWIDSGEEVAMAVRQELAQNAMLAPEGHNPTRRYLVTESPYRFEQLFEYYLGKPVVPQTAEMIDIGIG